jgi:hypothetical protein
MGTAGGKSQNSGSCVDAHCGNTFAAFRADGIGFVEDRRSGRRSNLRRNDGDHRGGKSGKRKKNKKCWIKEKASEDEASTFMCVHTTIESSPEGKPSK